MTDMEWDLMKKTWLLVLPMALFGMYWVSAAEKPVIGPLDPNDLSWIDFNEVGGDKVHPIQLMAGQRFIIHSEEQQEGVETLYTPINAPADAIADVSTPGQFHLEWKPSDPGIYYIKMHLDVLNGGNERWTIAILVAVGPDPLWWHEIFDE